MTLEIENTDDLYKFLSNKILSDSTNIKITFLSNAKENEIYSNQINKYKKSNGWDWGILFTGIALVTLIAFQFTSKLFNLFYLILNPSDFVTLTVFFGLSGKLLGSIYSKIKLKHTLQLLDKKYYFSICYY